MHELGLARTIAATIRERGWESSHVLVRVAGGHDTGDTFSESLLMHLAAAAPELPAGHVRVVHVPSPRVCGACASSFRAARSPVCPHCGGAPLPLPPGEEHIELELDEGAHQCA